MLLVAAAFSIATAIVYVFVGRIVIGRGIEGAAAMASQAFAAWWFMLAASSVLSATMDILGEFGVHDVALFIALTHVNLLVICVALLALLYYLVYLYTGWENAWQPMGLFYVVYFGLLAYWVAAGDPMGVEVSAWSTGLEYANDNQSGILFQMVLLLLLLPQIGGAVAYFTLFFKLTDPSQRYRVAVVSWALIIWFASSLFATQSRLSEFDWWPLASRSIGLAATLAILSAYKPPSFIRKAWGIRSVGGNHG